ncbi:ABC transporter permease [Roseovarius aestuarii]|uniref:Inner membrane ABC transporter permease protein YdcV n=1 Tax=Roseovarius aestuarii TaxID=475083 RepID=A0A1X7BY69_9RHOB|nr:ABC transporter permease [Roseovarius aestuarii]SMC14656.1 Inner membrane ABC transporter permease protein YdcV [Roseovarius aestuarii]
MKLLRNAYLAIFAIYLIGPIFVITAVSFNAKKFLAFPPRGFSFRWYAEIFVDSGWFNSLISSLLIALTSATLAVLIALPIAYAVWKSGLRYAKALFSLGVAPFILPPVIMALAFLLLFSSIGMNGLMINVIIAHAMFLLALPLVTISLGLESVDRALLEAAQTMGADGKTVFRTVILPIAAPFAFAGFAFCFVLSLNEYIIALMTVGFTVETLPIKIFNALRYGYTPVIASIAVVFLLINVFVFSLIARFSNLSRILGAMD